jgi:hypothetical protein
MTQNIAIPDDYDSPTPPQVLTIRPPRKWVPIDLRELWNYRELITTFTLMNIKLRDAIVNSMKAPSVCYEETWHAMRGIFPTR